MKLTSNGTTTQGNLVFEEDVEMGISAAAMALIVKGLTDMYSSPYVAVLREYTSNAWDAHFAAGQTRPVEVSLPSVLSPSLIIEDWGVGMDREQLRMYCQYGDSPKRASNDEIGGFGLGSKSGLAIATQFTVTSIKDGKKNVVVVRLRENAGPSMGMLGETDTDLPNGVKVTIPTNEVKMFRSAVTAGMFLGWLPGSILIDGIAPEDSVHDTSKYIKVGDAGWVSLDKSPTYGGRYTGSALIGPVAYDVDWESARLKVPHALRMGYLSRVVLNLENGSVDLPNNRENLRYSARTSNAIQARVDTMVAEGRKVYEDQINDAKSVRSAFLRMYTAHEYGFEGEYSYNGVPLKFAGTNNSLRTSPPLEDRISIRTHYNSGANSWASGESEYPSVASGLEYSRLDRTLIREEKVNVLVVGMDAPADPPATRRGFVGARRYLQSTPSVFYARYLAEKQDTSPSNVQTVFTAKQAKDLDPLFVALFDSIIPVDEFTETAVETRRALSRAKRAANVGTPRVLTGVRILTNRYAIGSKTYESKQLDDLDPTATYVLLKAGTDTLTDTVLRTLTTKYGAAENDRLIPILNGVFTGGKYVFIVATASMNTKKYAAALPNMVDIKTVLDERIQAARVALTDVQRIAARDNANRKHRWAEDLTSVHINQIQHAPTRDWIKAVSDSTTSRAFEALRQAKLAADDYGLDASGLDTSFSTEPSPGSRYPLLKDMYNGYGKEPHIVQYINLISQLDLVSENS